MTARHHREYNERVPALAEVEPRSRVDSSDEYGEFQLRHRMIKMNMTSIKVGGGMLLIKRDSYTCENRDFVKVDRRRLKYPRTDGIAALRRRRLLR